MQNINRLRAEQIVAMFTGDGMSFRIKPNVLNCKQMSDAVRVALQNRLVVVGYFDKQGLDVNGAMAEDGLPYSVMLSNRTDAMFVMRNPKGYNQGGTEGDDGLLHIISNEIVPRNIELYFMYPGQASKSSEVSLKPYTNFNYR